MTTINDLINDSRLRERLNTFTSDSLDLGISIDAICQINKQYTRLYNKMEEDQKESITIGVFYIHMRDSGNIVTITR
tara:strand:- start:54 stop:284 length:231 start_codon:yes stop_codon:yes gene_type:complete